MKAKGHFTSFSIATYKQTLFNVQSVMKPCKSAANSILKGLQFYKSFKNKACRLLH